MGWLAGWSKSKIRYISGASGSGTNYQMTMTILASDLDNQMNADFGDVRFTDVDGTTLLNYSRQSYISGTSATFLILIPDPSANTYIIVYYSKAGQATGGTLSSVYDIYIDGQSDQTASFTQRSIGNGNLATLGYDATNHRYTITAAQQDTAMFELLPNAGTQGYEYRSDYAFSTVGGVHSEFGMAVRYSASGLYYLSDYQRQTTNIKKLWIVREPNPPNAQYVDQTAGTVPIADRIGTTNLNTYKVQNTFYTFTGRVYGSNLYCSESLDGLSVTASDTTYGSGSLGLYVFYGGPVIYFKNLWVRKYVSPEPTFTTWSGERIQNQMISQNFTYKQVEDLIRIRLRSVIN